MVPSIAGAPPNAIMTRLRASVVLKRPSRGGKTDPIMGGCRSPDDDMMAARGSFVLLMLPPRQLRDGAAAGVEAVW